MTETTATWRGEIAHVRPNRDRLARLGEWYEAEYDRLFRFAYLIVRDKAAAEDLVQDAFVRLYHSRGRIEEAGFVAYARRTILNLARSGFRRRAIERRHDQSDVAEAGHADAVAAGEDLRRALRLLSLSDRACVVMRFYEDMDDAAIADALRISTAAAKKRCARAIARLRENMKEGAS